MDDDVILFQLYSGVGGALFYVKHFIKSIYCKICTICFIETLEVWGACVHDVCTPDTCVLGACIHDACIHNVMHVRMMQLKFFDGRTNEQGDSRCWMNSATWRLIRPTWEMKVLTFG